MAKFLIYATILLSSRILAGASAEDDSDDRINININRGHAAVVGAGGSSVSDSISQGYVVGIRRPGMADQTLIDKTESSSSTQTVGQAPPLAWTSANNKNVNGMTGGGAEAGYSGGTGVSYTESMSHTVEIPLDNMGTVMFSNLEKKPHHTGNAPHTGTEQSKATHAHKEPVNFR